MNFELVDWLIKYYSITTIKSSYKFVGKKLKNTNDGLKFILYVKYAGYKCELEISHIYDLWYVLHKLGIITIHFQFEINAY